MNEKNRVFFYGIIGAYLVYLAYDLFTNRGSDAGANSPFLLVICVVFAVAGILLLGLTVSKLRKVYQEGVQANIEAREKKFSEAQGKSVEGNENVEEIIGSEEIEESEKQE